MAEKFQAKAHHAYSKAKPDELDLSPGDIIHVTNDEHASWWIGQNQMTKEQGWFPSNFVTRLARPEGTSKPKLKTKRVVRIVKAYTAMDEDDLDLQVGDQVEVQKEVDGWFLGTLDSRSGMFPVGHAEVSERRPLPPTPVMCASRRGTFSGGSAPEVGLPVLPQAPPALPARTPSLPPRASTETSRPVERRFSVLSAAPVAEAADDGKKEKKSGHRISRLFGAKKSKSKEKEAASDLGSGIGSGEAASRRSFSSATDEPYHFDKQPVYDEQSEEEMISPALPSRPLPQPIAASSLGSPSPPAARPLPSIPQAGLTKLPALPSVAMPPPPATAPVPAPVLAAVTPERRASIASIKSQSSGVSAQYPPSQAPPVPELSAADKEGTTGEEPATEPDTESIAENTDAEEVAKVRGSAKLAKIIEDYEAQSSEELNLMSGDVITIVHRGTDEEPRWKGEYHGKKGYFPGTVVEAIEESADLDEEDDAVNRPRGGFKLAAYGVQQGGLGSIFAGGGGMPALRKSAPTRKSAEQEDQDNSMVAAAPMAMAPAMAPVIPKLRSVKRPQAEEQEPEQQPNFLAQLSRVPRKQVSSEDSAISAGSEPLAVAPVVPTIPAIPVSRKSTAASSIHELEPEPQAVHKDKTSNIEEEEEEERFINETSKAESIKEVDFYDRDLNGTIEAAEPEAAADTTEPQHSDDNNESKDVADEVDTSTSSHPSETAEEPSEDAQLSDDAPSSRASSLDPMKSPALSQVKRLVRRGPRQKPTAEGLKKSSEESQSQSLVSALQNDAVLPEPEPEVEKAAPPALPEKPKGLARSAFGGGMQLPTGGFKATGRVGSAMASRLAALQARASGNSAEDEDEDTSGSRRTLSGLRQPPTDSHVSAAVGAAPVPVAKKPSFTVRSAATKDAAPSAQPPVISAEWKKQVEDEHSRLRSDIDKASRGTEQQIARLEAKLASSEQENQAHKQNISGLERQVEGLLGQLTGVKSELSEIQKSVAEVGAHRGVTKDEVAVILRAELASALAPIKKQNGELVEENKKLHAKIAELRAYVDELVVEEEEQ